MPTSIPFHVFLSAVSSEFRVERAQLENWLERKGLHVSSQEKFNQGGSTLWQKLRDEVARCQAVVCIIGAEPGWPAGGELPPGVPERSWTQWEFWLAWGEQPWSPPRRENVYVFFPSDLDERLEKARQAAMRDETRLHALDLQTAHIDQIKKTSKHRSLFENVDDLIKQCLVLDLPTIERTKPNNLPYGSLGPLFKGRETKLEELHCHVMAGADQSPGSSGKVAIHGLGGVGKTRFAIEYALSHEKDYSGILFVTADAPESLRRNLAGLCQPLALNLPEQDIKEEAVQLNAALKWLQAHEGWLLILDNVDTPDAAAEVEQLVGPIKGGTVLITSRLSDWSGEVTSFELDELAESPAIDFLLARTKDRRQQLATDATDALTVARELGGLALALEQAGAFIAQKRSSIQAYLNRWRERDQAVRNWNDSRLTKYPRALVSTWDTTVEQLSPEARSLMDQLSWLAPESVPRMVFPEGTAQDALAELAGFSLVKFESGGMSFRVHRLVQEVTRGRQTTEKRDVSLGAILTALDQATVGDSQDVRSWPVLDPLRPHLSAVTTSADRHGIGEPTSRLMNDLGLLLFAKASHREAEPLIRRALAIDEASYGSNHPNVAIRLNNLASLLQETNRLVEAEPLMRRALEINEASYGGESPNVAMQLHNLASLLQETNRLAEAEPLMRRALAIDEVSYERDHPHVAYHFNNLALLLKETSRSAEAEVLLRRARTIDEAIYGPDHPNVARDLHNLSGLLQATNRLEEAEPLMRKALMIEEASYGSAHPQVATQLNSLAQLLVATNRLEEAESLLRRALAIDEASYGTDHPHVASRLNNLALLLKETDRSAEAESFMKRALAIDEVSYGPDHTEVARDLHNLAGLLQETNRLAAAEPLMRRVVVILLKFTKSTGHAHPRLRLVLGRYASLLELMAQGQDEVNRILIELGVQAGFDQATFVNLRQQLMQ